MVLITRRDLKIGYQCVQPAHALAEFAVKYPRCFKKWQTVYQNLVVLSVQDEAELEALSQKFGEQNLKYVLFREPDVNNQITAIAVQPHIKTYKLTSSLPLALKEFKV